MIDMSKWRSNDLANALLTRSMQAQASSPVEAFGQIAQSLMARSAIKRNEASNKSLLAQALMGTELPESSRAAVMTSGSPNTLVQALLQNEQTKAAAAQQQADAGWKMVGQRDQRSRSATANQRSMAEGPPYRPIGAEGAGLIGPPAGQANQMGPDTGTAVILAPNDGTIIKPDAQRGMHAVQAAAEGVGKPLTERQSTDTVFANRMTNRIAREQRMFETANASRFGSRAADNIADAAEPNGFDPAIATTLFEGRPFAPAMQAIARKITRSQGVAPGVAERVARTLMQTDSQLVRELLTSSGAGEAPSNRARAAMIGTLLQAGSTGARRLSAP